MTRETNGAGLPAHGAPWTEVSSEGFPQVPRQARLVVVETVYHQPPEFDATAFETRSGRFLESDEQPYVRRQEVADEWRPLETGWLTEAGLLVLRNEGTRFYVQPTPQQQAEADAKVLEIGVTDGVNCHVFAQVLPGESLRMQPVGLANLRLRSRAGTVKFVLSLFPV